MSIDVSVSAVGNYSAGESAFGQIEWSVDSRWQTC